MRISVLPEDPGYPSTFKHNPYTCRVLLDGKEVERCVTADEEKGLVVRLAASGDERWSRFGQSKDQGDSVAYPTDTLRGHVQLVWD